jgi:hypothetical protein
MRCKKDRVGVNPPKVETAKLSEWLPTVEKEIAGHLQSPPTRSYNLLLLAYYCKAGISASTAGSIVILRNRELAYGLSTCGGRGAHGLCSLFGRCTAGEPSAVIARGKIAYAYCVYLICPYGVDRHRIYTKKSEY